MPQSSWCEPFRKKPGAACGRVGLVAFACFVGFRHVASLRRLALLLRRAARRWRCRLCGAAMAAGFFGFFGAGFLATLRPGGSKLPWAIHFLMNALRLAPSSFWSSAPNLQVSIFCALVGAAEAGLASKRRGSRPMTAMVRSMVIAPLTGLDTESR